MIEKYDSPAVLDLLQRYPSPALTVAGAGSASAIAINGWLLCER